MVLTAPLIDGMDNGGGTGAVSGWCSSQPQPNSRPSFPKTIMVGLEGLPTSGAYELCLDSSPGHPLLYELCLDSSSGHPFLDRGCRYVSAISAVRGLNAI